jgi:hypothetical protein
LLTKKKLFDKEFAEIDNFVHMQVVMNCRIWIRDEKSRSGKKVRISNTALKTVTRICCLTVGTWLEKVSVSVPRSPHMLQIDLFLAM